MLFDAGAAGWEIVVGQERVKTILRNALRNNRLAHAYLFSGPAGAGMEAAAIALARAVLCGAADGAPCGSCAACGHTAALQHPNLHLHFPLPVGKGEKADDGPLARLTPAEIEQVRREISAKAADPYHRISVPRANQVKVNSIRELRRRASLGSFDGGPAVFLVFDAGEMTTEAGNALLKTLEEPAPGTLVVLTTPDPGSLLPTIVSRCQHVRFDPLGEDEVAAALVATRGVAAARAAMVAKLAGGNFSAAIGLAGADLDAKRNDAVEMLRCFLYKSPADALALIRESAEGGRDEIAASLILLQTWLRDAMLVSAGRPAEVNADDSGTIGKFVDRYPSLDYGALCSSIDRAVSDLRKNVYIHLVLHALRIDLRRAARAAAGADR